MVIDVSEILDSFAPYKKTHLARGVQIPCPGRRGDKILRDGV
jgi:hypothetical protein